MPFSPFSLRSKEWPDFQAEFRGNYLVIAGGKYGGFATGIYRKDDNGTPMTAITYICTIHLSHSFGVVNFQRVIYSKQARNIHHNHDLVLKIVMTFSLRNLSVCDAIVTPVRTNHMHLFLLFVVAHTLYIFPSRIVGFQVFHYSS